MIPAKPTRPRVWFPDSPVSGVSRPPSTEELSIARACEDHLRLCSRCSHSGHDSCHIGRKLIVCLEQFLLMGPGGRIRSTTSSTDVRVFVELSPSFEATWEALFAQYAARNSRDRIAREEATKESPSTIDEDTHAGGLRIVRLRESRGTRQGYMYPRKISVNSEWVFDRPQWRYYNSRTRIKYIV